MRATLHLISAGLLGLLAALAGMGIVNQIEIGRSFDAEVCLLAAAYLTAIANLIYAFKD